jgi:tryptophan synthase alpha chain
MSERLKNTLAGKRKLLIPYSMVGYPDWESSLKVFETLIENGGDIIEVGYPFSDPVADGPTIQEAHEKALRNGVGFGDVLEAIKHLRSRYPQVPLLVMTYYNPIFKIGLEKFVSAFKEAGADGFIVPDLPPEESQPLKEVTARYNLSLVMLAAPTSSQKRLKLICQTTDGFTYFVSVTGITGERDKLPLENLKRKLELYRQVCDKKVVVGFGISKKEHARLIGSLADGIVVGSLFVKLAGQGDLEGIKQAIKGLREGLEETL